MVAVRVVGSPAQSDDHGACRVRRRSASITALSPARRAVDVLWLGILEGRRRIRRRSWVSVFLAQLPVPVIPVGDGFAVLGVHHEVGIFERYLTGEGSSHSASSLTASRVAGSRGGGDTNFTPRTAASRSRSRT